MLFNTLPTRFRHYDVLKLLGRGGFGMVYLARDTKLRRNVVLKMLHVDLAADPDMVQRFVQEARAMARLDHNNIVRVYRVEDDPQGPFFEMEYVEGQTLKGYRGARALSLQEAMPILKQMAKALDAAHRQKMVHRDVKPDNVLIKPDGQLKLTDFGIIKLLEVTGTALAPTGDIIGTPSYMAPEQADINRKHEIGPATDIYALGVVTYELLSGRRPFEGHAHGVLIAHIHQAPPDPRQFNRYLSASVAQVLLNVLHKQPANRYPTAMSFVEALEQAVSSPPPPPPPPPPPSPPGISKQMMIGLAVLLLVGMIVGGVLRELFSTSPEPTPEIALATSTPAAEAEEPTEAPLLATATPQAPQPAPATSEPTAPSQSLTATSVSLTATSVSLTATSVSLTATSVPPVLPTETPVAPTATTVPTETPLPPAATPTLGIGSTIVSDKDGMTLLYVPEGEFLMGSKEDDPDANDDGREHPQRSIYLDAFWIDKTEVTNELFSRFVDETGHQTDAEKEGWGWAFTGETWEQTDGADWQHPNGPDSSVEGLEQHPVVQISWNDAKAYCEWAGRELPTEAQWEKAARGTDGRKYPWGNQDVAGNLVNLCDKNCPYSNNRIDSIDDGYEFTAPVGTYPDGVSPYGALDMAGNVWEWTADWYDADYYKNDPEPNPQGPDAGEFRVLRGGSWNNEARRVRGGNRGRDDPGDRNDNNGVRCAAPPSTALCAGPEFSRFHTRVCGRSVKRAREGERQWSLSGHQRALIRPIQRHACMDVGGNGMMVAWQI